MKPGVGASWAVNTARGRSKARTAGGSRSGCPDLSGFSQAAFSSMASIFPSPRGIT